MSYTLYALIYVHYKKFFACEIKHEEDEFLSTKIRAFSNLRLLVAPWAQDSRQLRRLGFLEVTYNT